MGFFSGIVTSIQLQCFKCFFWIFVSDFLVIANCKQGGSFAYFLQLIDAIKKVHQAADKESCQVVLLPPVPYLNVLSLKNFKNFSVGVQSVSAFMGHQITGDVTANMVKEMGASCVCIGHSERRLYCSEDENAIALQYQQTVLAGLNPILCVGETLEQRNKGQTLSVLESQLSAIFFHDDFDKLPKHDIILAYEPVWAIGAKQAASMEQVEDAFEFLHQYLEKQSVFGRRYFCYGGSVNQTNCQQFYDSDFVSGLLVGRCCLNIDGFMGVLDQCSGF